VNTTIRPVKASEGAISTTQEARHTEYQIFRLKASQ